MKLIDEKLGGTTPLESYIKISRRKLFWNLVKMMNLKAGMTKAVKTMKNTGLQKIKLKKFKMFIII